jgi:glutamine amidotransferase
MCLAAFHTRGYSLTEEEFDNAARANSDGVGFAYYSKKNIIVPQKGVNIKEMKDRYFSAVEKNGERSPFIIHFRLATHGSVRNENCHPFRINKHDIMIHNGVLPVIYQKGETRTDTQVFADEYLSKMPENWFDNDYMFDMVAEYCSGSKLIIMTNNPSAKHGVYIVNQEDGKWQDNNNRWFSNLSHESCDVNWWANYRKWDKGIKESAILEQICELCGVREVLDDVCYSCGTCQECYGSYGDCKCNAAMDPMHSMTSKEFNEYQMRFGGLE